MHAGVLQLNQTYINHTNKGVTRGTVGVLFCKSETHLSELPSRCAKSHTPHSDIVLSGTVKLHGHASEFKACSNGMYSHACHRLQEVSLYFGEFC